MGGGGYNEKDQIMNLESDFILGYLTSVNAIFFDNMTSKSYGMLQMVLSHSHKRDQGGYKKIMTSRFRISFKTMTSDYMIIFNNTTYKRE